MTSTQDRGFVSLTRRWWRSWTATVATGKASSRAALVAVAVEREMRRQAAEQDAQVLREHGPADDLDDLVQWSSTHLLVEDLIGARDRLVRLDKQTPASTGLDPRGRAGRDDEGDRRSHHHHHQRGLSTQQGRVGPDNG